MARSRESKIELTAYDDLFQTDESREEAKLSKIRDIPIAEIDEFPDHPFKVLMDEDMEQLVDSIKRNGVMTPATVRLKEDGRYELISGHRRKKACELAGLDTLKCEVKELTLDEAIILMVESNLQRSTILPSEKAFAYKMRLEAMNRQGQRTDLTSRPVGEKLFSVDKMSKDVSDSSRQIHRFIRLTELVPEILQMVDDRQIAFRPAVEISYLSEEQQYTLLEAMQYNDATPSLAQAIKMKKFMQDHYPEYLKSVEAPQYEIDTQEKVNRQRFIDAHCDLPPADKRDTLSLRLSDFIRDLDGYEKSLLENVNRNDLADVTAEQMEQHLSDPATVQQLIDFLALVQGKTSDIYSRSNAWRFSQELLELYPLRYLYHEDDVVYIGADKYEVVAFDENAVSLRNPEFPLFGKELSRADFEEKLKENPANDHLKVVVTKKQKTEIPPEQKPDGIQFSIGFSEHPAFYDRQFNDRYTDLSFALGNYLLGVLDEKQHREREGDDNVGWYHKTDFDIYQ